MSAISIKAVFAVEYVLVVATRRGFRNAHSDIVGLSAKISQSEKSTRWELKTWRLHGICERHIIWIFMYVDASGTDTWLAGAVPSTVVPRI